MIDILGSDVMGRVEQSNEAELTQQRGQQAFFRNLGDLKIGIHYSPRLSKFHRV